MRQRLAAALRGWGKFVVLWLLVRGIGRLPVGVTYRLGAAAAMLAWACSRHIREVTRDHARHVLGPQAAPREVDELARAYTRSVAYYYADFARLPRVSPLTVFDCFDEIVGVDVLFEALDEGRGVVLMGAHLGGAELLAQAAAPFEICLGVVTEPLEPRRVHEFIADVRGHNGVSYFPATSLGLRAAYAHLRRGGSLGLLVDRDVLGTAAAFPFFGERAPMPTGAVELARRTEAPLIAAWVPRTGRGRYALHLERIDLPPPSGDREADVESGMQVAVAALERAIRRWPGQWFVLAPIWGETR